MIKLKLKNVYNPTIKIIRYIINHFYTKKYIKIFFMTTDHIRRNSKRQENQRSDMNIIQNIYTITNTK